jgi:hypothetical protein
MLKSSIFLRTVVAAAICLAANFSAFAQTSVWDGTHTIWTKGNGTQTDPYLLETAQQLAYLAYYVNQGTEAVNYVVGSNTYWKLTVDVDLNSLSWTPIGFYVSGTDHYEFGGHFDGSGHTVANLQINGESSAGLFARMNGGSIRNIEIVGNSSIVGIASTGGIVGWATGTIIIENCYNKGNVSSTSNVGGIIGCVDTGDVIINNCYNAGNLSSNSSTTRVVGGIVGYSYVSNLTINNCYNTGNISNDDTQYAGGIVGHIDAGDVTVNNCYNTGNILAVNYSGGIIGNSDTGEETSTYWEDDYRRKELKGKVKTAVEWRMEYPYGWNKLIFDQNGNLLEDGSYYFDKLQKGLKFRYNNQNRITRLEYYSGGELNEFSEFTYGGENSHNVYIPSNLETNDLRLQKGITNLDYYWGFFGNMKAKCISVNGNELKFEMPTDIGQAFLIVIMQGNYPAKIEIEGELEDEYIKETMIEVTLGNDGLPTTLYNYMDGTITNYIVVEGFLQIISEIEKNFETGVIYTTYEYTYNEHGHIATETIDGVLRNKYTYEYDAQGNWTKCEIEDCYFHDSYILYREYTYWE